MHNIHPFKELPVEITTSILSYLDAKDLVTIEQTDHFFKNLMGHGGKSHIVWKICGIKENLNDQASFHSQIHEIELNFKELYIKFKTSRYPHNVILNLIQNDAIRHEGMSITLCNCTLNSNMSIESEHLANYGRLKIDGKLVNNFQLSPQRNLMFIFADSEPNSYTISDGRKSWKIKEKNGQYYCLYTDGSFSLPSSYSTMINFKGFPLLDQTTNQSVQVQPDFFKKEEIICLVDNKRIKQDIYQTFSYEERQTLKLLTIKNHFNKPNSYVLISWHTDGTKKTQEMEFFSNVNT